MASQNIPGGVVHDLPADLNKALSSDSQALEAWESLTPLARNEWICWTISVKKKETRLEHVERVISELKEGIRRPCCWIGCIHRTDKPISKSVQYILNKKGASDDDPVGIIKTQIVTCNYTNYTGNENTNKEKGEAMPKYVDGFVLVVPNDKTEEYRKMAEEGRDSWMKHGALSYFECRGDDLVPQEMGDQKARAFPEMANAGNDETVWFSFIVFKSKEHRDEVNAKVMAEMNEQAEKYKDMVMPFDMKKMCYGGFQVEVEG